MIFLDLYKLRCHNRMEGHGKLSLACLLFSKFILACDCLSQLVGSIYISNTFYYIYIFPCEICDIILKEDLLNSSSVQFSSVTQSCLTLWDPMDCSMPGLPAHHQLLEFTQTHVHWVGDAIQPSHPLLSPSPPAFNLPQHQGLFKWVCSSHQVAKVLELQLQFFQWVLRVDFL